VAEGFDEFVDDVDDRGVKALDGTGGEGLGHDAADTLVCRTFHAQKRVDDLVVERSGGDAGGGEVEAGWDLEAAVTKDGSHEFVRNHFGSKGSQRDGCLLLGREKQWIELSGRGGEVVVEGWQAGVKHARAGGVDGH
jgi:hypothetical protein